MHATANNEMATGTQTLSSLPFRMSGGSFARTLLFRFGLRWMLGLGFGCVIAVAAGIIFDWRWFMVGIMFILVVAPGVMGIIYYSAALRKECYINFPEHTLHLCPGGVDVELWERRVFIPLSGDEIRSVNASGTMLTLGGRGRKGFLWIPLNAFPTEKEYVNFIRGLENRIVRRD